MSTNTENNPNEFQKTTRFVFTKLVEGGMDNFTAQLVIDKLVLQIYNRGFDDCKEYYTSKK